MGVGFALFNGKKKKATPAHNNKSGQLIYCLQTNNRASVEGAHQQIWEDLF
jgi:hypothetical protein